MYRKICPEQTDMWLYKSYISAASPTKVKYLFIYLFNHLFKMHEFKNIAITNQDKNAYETAQQD